MKPGANQNSPSAATQANIIRRRIYQPGNQTLTTTNDDDRGQPRRTMLGLFRSGFGGGLLRVVSGTASLFNTIRGETNYSDPVHSGQRSVARWQASMPT